MKSYKLPSLLFAAFIITGVVALCVAQTKHHGSLLGYTDTPLLPDGKWHVHDLNRPQPVKITAGTCSTQTSVGRPPSDAEVLFDGKELSKWRGAKGGPASWAVRHGYMEVVPHSGDIYTREEFGPIQLHVEWRTPAPLKPGREYQGNSGVFLQGFYELQVFESSLNLIYADGEAGAIYGQYPPLVNSSRDPGRWQDFDIIFSPGRFANGNFVVPPYITAFQNGVLIQNHTAIIGDSMNMKLPIVQDHGPTGPIRLQDHEDLVRYRNIWVRRL
jgi:hypothetical protein